MAAIDDADSILLIGSHIRHEAPILGQRVRKAWRKGAQVAALNPLDWNLHFTLADKIITAPQHMVAELAALAGAVAKLTGKEATASLQAAFGGVEAGESHTAMAEMLNSGGNSMLILGQAAMAHAQASWLRQLSAWISEATGSTLNMIPHGGNTTGAVMAGALPGQASGGAEAENGLNARQMLTTPMQAYLLWDIEPEYDIANPAMAKSALASANTVVAVSTFASEDLKACADVILPLAPLAESEGLLYSIDGQSFSVEPAASSAGQSRSGWKILRRLGTELELDGFSQVNIASLREEMLAEIGGGDYTAGEVELAVPGVQGDLYRVGEVAMYAVDGLCRRSEHLQHTVHAENSWVGLNPDDAGSKGLVEDREVKVSQGNGHITLPVCIFNELPVGAVWVKSATNESNELGDSFGPISVEAV